MVVADTTTYHLPDHWLRSLSTSGRHHSRSRYHLRLGRILSSMEHAASSCASPASVPSFVLTSPNRFASTDTSLSSHSIWLVLNSGRKPGLDTGMSPLQASNFTLIKSQRSVRRLTFIFILWFRYVAWLNAHNSFLLPYFLNTLVWENLITEPNKIIHK